MARKPKQLVAQLNGAARTLFGEATRVRVRKRDGEVQVLPTARRQAYGLPEGETIVDLQRSGNAIRFALPETPTEVDKPQRLEGRPWKWLALVASDAISRAHPALKLRS